MQGALVFTIGVGGSIFQQAKDDLKVHEVDPAAIKKAFFLGSQMHTPSFSRPCRQNSHTT